MIKVSVINTIVRENKGIGKASGKPFHMHMQKCYAFTHDRDSGELNPFPEAFDIILKKDPVGNPEVYQPGDYQLHPSSIFMGQYGLEVAPKLVPLKRAA